MVELLVLSVACFAGGVVLHLGVTHILHSSCYVRNAYVLFAIVCVALLPVTSRLGLPGAVFVYSALVMLWNSYLIFFVNLMNSVSLRLMGELRQAPGGKLSLQQLQGVYSDEAALDSRLGSLVHNGLLVDQGAGGLALTGKGRALARVLAASRALFGIDEFG